MLSAMSDPRGERRDVEPVEPLISVSQVMRTISRYRGVILLALLGIALLYALAVVFLVTTTPVARTTTQRFRVNFQGASEGRYPNGQDFSSSEIVSTWILNDVFQADQLERFMTIDAFTRSLAVLDASPEYDAAAADYRARLADPRLSPVDRERIVREWNAKRTTLNRNQFELVFARTERTRDVPDPVIQKALVDILSTWAKVAATEQHVLEYPVSVLSKSFVAASASDPHEPMVAALMLRDRIRHVLENVREIEHIPGSELIRSTKQHTSLQEIRIKLDEVMRFRLDPLVRTIHAAGLVQSSDQALRFAETQQEYDRGLLRSQEMSINAVREAMTMYTAQVGSQAAAPQSAARGTAASGGDQAGRTPSETVMPQLGESFINRIAELTSASTNLVYREKLIDEYRRLSERLIPAREAVDYDEQLVAFLRTPARAGGGSATAVTADLESIRGEVAAIIDEVNEIFQSMSRNRTPVSELVTTMAPPISRSVRAINMQLIALAGVLIFLVSVPIVIGFVLFRDRMRREFAIARMAG